MHNDRRRIDCGADVVHVTLIGMRPPARDRKLRSHQQPCKHNTMSLQTLDQANLGLSRRTMP
jgi:hypothetical protein